MSDTSDTKTTVTFATLSAGHPHIAHMRSCQAVMGHGSLGPSYDVLAVTNGTSGPYLDIGRNQLVKQLLDDPVLATSDWFVFLDDDIAFTPAHATALLDTAIAQNTRIASGPYWCLDPNFGEAICAYKLTAYDPAIHPDSCHWSIQPDGQFLRVLSFDELGDEPLPVTSFGAGFMAVHRTLLEEFADAFAHPQKWFAEMVLPSGHPESQGGLWHGEDHMFCLRAIALGETPILVPGARGIIHYKTVGMVVPAPNGQHEKRKEWAKKKFAEGLLTPEQAQRAVAETLRDSGYRLPGE